MARRGHGEGTINKLPSGRWRAQVSVGGRRLSATRDTRRECQDWIREITRQIAAGLTYDGTKTTLRQFILAWLETKRSALRPQTHEQYARLARKYIIPGLGQHTMNELNAARIQAFYDQLQKDGAGARTVEVVHAIVHGCLKHALRLGLVPVNPAAAAIVPRPKKAEMKVWTEAQVSQFLISIAGHRNEILYHLALATGMRRGELLGLQWGDIDWPARTISVRRQVYRPSGGGFIFQEPKTERGQRQVMIGTGIIERLRDQLARVDHMRDAENWQEYDLIFPSAVGTPQNGYNISRDFKKLALAAGLPAIRFHDCRHTAASLMLSHGIPPMIVAGMLGHSLAVLMARYAHFIPSTQSQAAELMDSLTTPVKIDLHK